MYEVTQAVDEPCGRVHHRLKTPEQVARKTGQDGISISLQHIQLDSGPKKTLKFRSTCMYRPTEKIFDFINKNVRLD